MPSIAEYIYIDTRRLDTYFEQFSSPLKREKTAKWKTALSLSGPSVEAEQSSVGRAFTQHEKIAALLEVLRPTLSDKSSEPNFAIATCSACRAFLPPSLSKKGKFVGLSIWICWPPGTERYFFLVEDFAGKDEPARSWSGNTVLSFLLRELGRELGSTGTEASSRSQERWEFEVPGDKFSSLQRDKSLAELLKVGGVPLEGGVVVKTCGLIENYVNHDNR